MPLLKLLNFAGTLGIKFKMSSQKRISSYTGKEIQELENEPGNIMGGGGLTLILPLELDLAMLLLWPSLIGTSE